jgi:hypothetical protein
LGKPKGKKKKKIPQIKYETLWGRCVKMGITKTQYIPGFSSRVIRRGALIEKTERYLRTESKDTRAEIRKYFTDRIGNFLVKTEDDSYETLFNVLRQNNLIGMDYYENVENMIPKSYIIDAVNSFNEGNEPEYVMYHITELINQIKLESINILRVAEIMINMENISRK